jgi:hypothetical protein
MKNIPLLLSQKEQELQQELFIDVFSDGSGGIKLARIGDQKTLISFSSITELEELLEKDWDKKFLIENIL